MQLCSLRIEVTDEPGALAAATAALAAVDANIVELDVHGAVAETAVDELVVALRRPLDLPAIALALDAAGVRVVHLRPADPHELADRAVRALDAAASVLASPRGRPERLARAAAALVGADHAWLLDSSVPAAGVCEAARADGSPHQAREELHLLPGQPWVLAVPGPAGVLGVARRDPPFTFTETARLQALLRTASTTDVVELAEGGAVELRPLVPADRPALERMHRRCSAESRYRRYLTGTAPHSPAVLDRLVAVDDGTAAIAACLATEIVGLGHLAPDGEVAFLVEDGHQRRGIGTALVRRLLRAAGARGLASVVAIAHPDYPATGRVLRRAGAGVLRTTIDDGLLRYEVTVAAGRRGCAA